MRSGHIGGLAAVLLLSSACAQGTGVAGVATKPPETPPVASPSVTATIPETTATTVPTSEHQAGAIKPPAEEPVKVPPPKLSKYSYVFPVKGCSTSYQKRLLVLPKTTIWAGRGCAFVSPVDGVVDEVNLQNRWKPSVDAGATREGRFVTIIGEDGVRYLGGHLDTIDEGVRPGVKVKAGQRLGTVGNTGNARDTAPNLYFAISWKTGPAYWWVRRGMVNPWNYLDAWREGNATFSPRHETFELRGKVGETPGCTVQCSAKKPSKKAEREEEPPRPQPTPEPTAQPTTFPA